MKRGGEGGSAAILVLGMCLFCFAVAGLAVDGMRSLLERRALQGLADSAARAAASRIDPAELYRGRAGIHLERNAARARAAELLDRRPVASSRISVSSRVVRVEVRSTVETTLLRAVGIDALPVGASAEAQPVFGEPYGPK